MIEHKKGLYYYFMLVASIFVFPLALSGLLSLKAQYIDETLWSDMLLTAKHSFMVIVEIHFISELLKHSAGYTIITTTEYKLFKCRNKNEEEPFMMFADNIEQLERFFEYTQPDKQFFIEEAEMTGKSIQMKVFNGEESE